MKLKSTVFTVTIGLVLLISFSLMALLYTLYSKEMHTQARKDIKESYQFIQEHANTKIETIISSIERINAPIQDKMEKLNREKSQNIDESKLKYLQIKIEELSPILDELSNLAKSLGEQKVQISLYDANGVLMLHYSSVNNLTITMSAYLPNIYPNALITLRERKMVTWSHSSISLLEEDYIQKVNSLDNIKTTPIIQNLMLYKKIEKDDIQNRKFSMYEDNLAINYQIPLSNHQHYSNYFHKLNQELKKEEKYNGMIDLNLQFDSGEISKIASITGTHINLFVNNNFSKGTFYTKNNYVKNDLESLDLKQFLTLSDIPKLHNKTIDNQDYYESQFSIKTDVNIPVILSIMESREVEYVTIESFFKKTSFIIFLFIFVVFIFTLLVSKILVIPIVQMNAVINKLAKGDLEIEEKSRDASPFFEVQKMQQALDKLINTEIEISSLANKVANGDYKQSIPERSSKDTLMNSLNSMVKQLSTQNDKIFQTNQILKKLSITDGLTGLNNRRYFDEKLKYYYNIAKRNSLYMNIFMLDIDYFKKYNDHFGHQEGDTCLQLVAQGIADCVQREDDFVARYGGEEFTVITLGMSKNSAMELGENICRKVETLQLPHPLSEYQHVTVSIGISSKIPTENDFAEDILKSADEALYKAKESGRNRFEIVFI